MKKLFENFWFGLLLGFAILQFATDAGRTLLKKADRMEVEIQQLQKENKMLKEAQNTMIWTMDSGCYNQIKNNFDHAMFLKLSPVEKK